VNLKLYQNKNGKKTEKETTETLPSSFSTIE
jgi:hypothetical protein